MNHPKVHVVILNWNGLQDTTECLESLRNIDYPNYEVLVVDNGSERNDAEVLKKRFGDFVLVIENDRNYGFAEGCNIGMRYALETTTLEYILLLNNDTTVDPGFLSEMIEVAQSDTSIGITGPVVYDYYDTAEVRTAGGRIHWLRGIVSLFRLADSGELSPAVRQVDFIEGSCMLVRREMIDRVGMLNAEYFSYWEDTDWCVRCQRNGYKLYCALKARIWHKAPHSYLESTKLYLFLRNNILFMRRNALRKDMALFLPYFLFCSIPLFTLKHLLKHPFGTVMAVGKALVWNLRN